MTGRLTYRQREVLVLLDAGHSYATVAIRLGISRNTVRQHVRDIAARLPGDGSPLRRVLLHARRLLHDAAA